MNRTLKICLSVALIMTAIGTAYWMRPIDVFAQPSQVPSLGTLCWAKNTDPDLAGYRYYIGATSGVPLTTIDAGLLTTPPDPPVPASACLPAEVGVVRNMSNLLTGTYYFGVAAYDVTGNLSGYAEVSKYVYNDANKIQKFFNQYFRRRSEWPSGSDKAPA